MTTAGHGRSCHPVLEESRVCRSAAAGVSSLSEEVIETIHTATVRQSVRGLSQVDNGVVVFAAPRMIFEQLFLRPAHLKATRPTSDLNIDGAIVARHFPQVGLTPAGAEHIVPGLETAALTSPGQDLN